MVYTTLRAIFLIKWTKVQFRLLWVVNVTEYFIQCFRHH
nr:MAG TPA: hypothetical protein [Caudoviricetes sp.]